ncbi:MAG: response regulator [Acidobacteria bacterium]|jgi:CheY-like chemotaxis protein|nr:response regulator [Acidobacteriota bacterium]
MMMDLARTPSGPRRILVVDDDADVRNGLARALALRGGYQVAAAADAFEAGYQFARQRPDLVILDLVMPGMGGLEVCVRMRRLAGAERLKIVVLTAHSVSGNSERSLLSGADLFLTKPQDVETLITHIGDLLGD